MQQQQQFAAVRADRNSDAGSNRYADGDSDCKSDTDGVTDADRDSNRQSYADADSIGSPILGHVR
ncbi:MAG: hypothetical protein JO359_00410 [Candidatus Eremiobacteraeota bacterium]|nr:hypothetical protein [Candidatus Eremiobacteraeota bacterium]